MNPRPGLSFSTIYQHDLILAISIILRSDRRFDQPLYCLYILLNLNKINLKTYDDQEKAANTCFVYQQHVLDSLWLDTFLLFLCRSNSIDLLLWYEIE